MKTEAAGKAGRWNSWPRRRNEVLVSRFVAGEDLFHLMNDYGLTPGEIEVILREALPPTTRKRAGKP